MIVSFRSYFLDKYRYKRGTIPGSVNIPFQTAFCPEGELVPCPAVQTLNSNRSKVKVVVGSKNRNAANVSNMLTDVSLQVSDNFFNNVHFDQICLYILLK